MRKFFLIATLLAATPALAADLNNESVLGKTTDEVQASLVDMGYEVRKIEMEDGKIEAYFVKEGHMGEVYVDAGTGKVAKLDMK